MSSCCACLSGTHTGDTQTKKFLKKEEEEEEEKEKEEEEKEKEKEKNRTLLLRLRCLSRPQSKNCKVCTCGTSDTLFLPGHGDDSNSRGQQTRFLPPFTFTRMQSVDDRSLVVAHPVLYPSKSICSLSMANVGQG